MDAVYTFPGPGVTGVPFSQLVRESDETGTPFTPGQSVGLGVGMTTGPYVIVFTGDIWRPTATTITAASLVGPAGPVDVAIADGEYVIPRRPLSPLTTYTATVSVHFSGVRCIRAQSPAGSTSIPPCPPSIPSFCATDPQTATVLHVRLCDPGESSDAYYTYPDEDVGHQWSFTTASAPSHELATPRRTCRPTLLAPLRAHARGRVIVRYRTCALAGITAELDRLTSSGRWHRLKRRIAHVARAQRGRLILSLRAVKPGRYLLRVRITGTAPATLSRHLTVTRR